MVCRYHGSVSWLHRLRLHSVLLLAWCELIILPSCAGWLNAGSGASAGGAGD
jgi:hypothetical protein